MNSLDQKKAGFLDESYTCPLIYPLIAQWNITNRCNSRCIYCSAGAGKKGQHELNTAQCLQVVEKLAQAGVRHVFIQGGEIFLRNDIWEILARMKQCHLRISTSSNGYFSPQTLKKLLNYPNLFNTIQININAFSDHQNQIIINRPWKVGRVFQTVSLLLQAGHKVRVQTVVNRCNIDELQCIYETIAKAGVEKYLLMPVFPLGRAIQGHNWELLHVSQYDFYQKIICIFKKIPGNGLQNRINGKAQDCRYDTKTYRY